MSKKQIIIVAIVAVLLASGVWLNLGGVTAEVKEGTLTAEVKEGTLTAEGAVFVIRNTTPFGATFGESYAVERADEKGNWTEVTVINENAAWNLSAYLLGGRGRPAQRELEIRWTWLYGELEPGNYRFIKYYDRFLMIGERKMIAEFTI